jgi:hypothetical protein
MKCTKCNIETNQVRTIHKRNINGKKVSLIPDGERWCPLCVKKSGLPTLSDINEERRVR